MSHFNDLKPAKAFALDSREYPSAPAVIEGAQVLDVLCPINPTTLLREPLESALKRAVADPKLQQLVAPFLQELPTIKSDPRLTDADRFDLMVDRFSIGTPAENDAVRESLMPFTDILFKSKEPAPAPAPAPEPAPAPAAE